VQQEISDFLQIALVWVHTKYYEVCVMRTKRAFEKSVRTTITMPPRLLEVAETVLTSRGFGGLSDYLQDLVRSDVDKRKPQLLAAR
jgi:hypothetical protein